MSQSYLPEDQDSASIESTIAFATQQVELIPATVITRVPGVGQRTMRSTEGLMGSHTGNYNSFAGVDIVAQIVLPNEEPMTLGELQTISYSIHRENHPVRTLGHVSPVGFVRSGRTIAGSMIFTVFNNYAFYKLRQYREAIANDLYPLADMLPPLDIVLTFANEYGIFSKMKIYGITFIDEGGTMSIDDLITESTLTYMARGIQPLTGYSAPSSTDFFS